MLRDQFVETLKARELNVTKFPIKTLFFFFGANSRAAPDKNNDVGGQEKEMCMMLLQKILNY